MPLSRWTTRGQTSVPSLWAATAAGWRRRRTSTMTIDGVISGAHRAADHRHSGLERQRQHQRDCCPAPDQSPTARRLTRRIHADVCHRHGAPDRSQYLRRQHHHQQRHAAIGRDRFDHLPPTSPWAPGRLTTCPWSVVILWALVYNLMGSGTVTGSVSAGSGSGIYGGTTGLWHEHLHQQSDPGLGRGGLF